MELVLTGIGIFLLAMIGSAAIIGVIEVLILVGKNIFGIEEEEE